MQKNKLFRLLGVTFVASVLSLSQGCAYRSDLAQGNFVEQDAVDKLSYGMTGDQVRYILGTPMLVDPFDNSRWYYVHFLRQGWDDPKIQNLVLLFSGNSLIDVTGDLKKPAGFVGHDAPTNNQALPDDDYFDNLPSDDNSAPVIVVPASK